MHDSISVTRGEIFEAGRLVTQPLDGAHRTPLGQGLEVDHATGDTMQLVAYAKAGSRLMARRAWSVLSTYRVVVARERSAPRYARSKIELVPRGFRAPRQHPESPKLWRMSSTPR